MSVFTRTDVTALKIHNEYVLAGIGSNLEVYHKISGKFIQKIKVLKGQKIYGIVPFQSGLQFLIFGGKQFTILSQSADLLDDNIFSCKIEPIVCDDWLHSGIWMLENKVALLTAHNVVQVWKPFEYHLEVQHISEHNSILYSGLLLPLQDDVLVFSGTVFSEVLIHTCTDLKPLHVLKGHRGVIFSITCKPEQNIVVTTSDDRSVRVWNIQNDTILKPESKAYWVNGRIYCTHELYGHTARVMRNCITTDYIISIGEDSRICFWNHQGELLKTVENNQNGCLWSLDTDNDCLVTGGGDCGVTLYPLTLLTDYSQKYVISDIVTPKKLEFTARKNIVIMSEENELLYYKFNSKTSELCKLDHTSTYKLLSLSPCKQIIAIADMNGKFDVFIENCKNDEISRVFDTTLNLGKLLSLHFASNRHLVLCSDKGIITVLASKQTDFEVYDTFILPSCKERWVTCCAINIDKNILVVSDRCGNVHIFSFGMQDPVKTFKKVHGKYGATSIIVKNNNIITTGRDGTIKHFSYQKDSKIKYMFAKNLDFQWVEKFLDKNENFICGFQERIFMVYDVKNDLKVIEVNCGGGHRSWDAIKYFEKVDNDFKEFIKLIYVKNSVVHVEIFEINKIMPFNIANGTHSKEINCLKTFVTDSRKFFMSGGEDTTLRISSLSRDLDFKDEFIFKQLSSIKTLKTYFLDVNQVLLVSAGGRAEICVKIVTFDDNDKITSEEIIDYQIKGTDKDRNRNWKNRAVDFDPETRIMDLEVHKISEFNFIVTTGCSDAFIRTFELKIDKIEFNMIQEIKYHKTCILKTHLFNFCNKYILVTCTTRGDVAFWEINGKVFDTPLFVKQTNKSGINSMDIKIIDKNRFLLATGGDDNAIHLNLFTINEEKSIEVKSSWYSDKFHCSEITGLKLVDDLLISTSVDQRLTMFQWSEDDDLKCEFRSQVCSDVADIQGMDVVDVCRDSITVCVFGKGMEVIKLPRAQ